MFLVSRMNIVENEKLGYKKKMEMFLNYSLMNDKMARMKYNNRKKTNYCHLENWYSLNFFLKITLLNFEAYGGNEEFSESLILFATQLIILLQFIYLFVSVECDCGEHYFIC